MTEEPECNYIERTTIFFEDDVEAWCQYSHDFNPIHIDVEKAEGSTFGQRVVPGMMVMDQLSGMLTALGGDEQEVILAGITAARFRDPVLFDEPIEYTIEVDEVGKQFVTVDFEVRAPERDSLTAHGVLSIVIK